MASVYQKYCVYVTATVALINTQRECEQVFHWERNKEKNYYSDVKNSQGWRLNGRRTGNAGW